ncbi:helix-turn-helix domain-containing protein [Granulicella sp. S190]|uniref:helix-turn-helix domain-containing protein n=1 Tax=Granulicella sp. S190 TaxID=1747226 RepID=UPI00131B5DC1|nr:helix-turn-helix domain-containing protein [Granulicella sp. S190]
MQNNQLLVRRPCPNRTESKLGYILKLSEKNGYVSPQAVLTRAGTKFKRHNTIDAMTKLAHIAGLTATELLSIVTHWGEPDRMFCRLMGQRIHSADLQFQQKKVCPECVKAKGFIEAHFDLAVMIACPVHGKLLLTHCSQCSAEIRWERPGLLKCHCGAALIQCDDSLVSPAVRELLDIVRRKALLLEPGADYSSGVPDAQLWKMNLQSLIYLIGALGRRVVGGRSAVKWNDYGRIVSGAAEILANWPHGFHDWLRELTADIPDDVPLKLTTQPLRGIYFSLGYGVRPRSEAIFLRHALSAFVVNHLGAGCHDREFRATKNEYVKRYIPVNGFAEMLGIDPRTAQQLIKRQRLPTVEIERARYKRTLVDLTKVTLLTRSPGKVCRRQVAAKAIGISSELLSSLKKSGDFQVSHLPKGMSGFHESDIKVFVEKLVAIASQQSMGRDEAQRLIRLEFILQRSFCTVEEKADIVRRLLHGSLEAWGCDDGTIGGILVPVSAIGSSGRRVLRDHTRALFTKTAPAAKDGGRRMSSAEAASYLNCSKITVYKLLEQRLIQAAKQGNMWLIEEEELRKFSTTYVQIASVAKELRTSPCALAQFCAAHGIPTIPPGQGTRSGNQLFICAKDESNLLAFNLHSKPKALYRRNRRSVLAA